MLSQYIKILYMDKRSLLNELKWHEGYDFDKVRIWYTSRGSENDTAFVTGSEVEELEKHFFKTKDGMIPYHRITKIEYGGKVVFEV